MSHRAATFEENRLIRAMDERRQTRKKGVAPYVTAGDGGMDTTLEVLKALDQAGAACIELGIPFSDPIADGPVLQEAADRALQGGATLQKALEMLRTFRDSGARTPVAIMSYLNPLLQGGLDQVCERIANAGGDALIVPDVPLEEGSVLEQACANAHLCPIFFATPTSSDERIVEAGLRTRGFLYVVGRTGVTGAGTSFDSETMAFLERAQSLSKAPVAVGFGITTADDVRSATQHADLAIVGTALVRRLHQVENPAGEARTFTEHLLTGVC
ncbi:MAG: tryptophan synthase subunit alpha [Planctomycetes bacterium]|nr:tryptophan synthase subunit alpha [Planctomycetota bacterium]